MFKEVINNNNKKEKTRKNRKFLVARVPENPAIFYGFSVKLQYFL